MVKMHALEQFTPYLNDSFQITTKELETVNAELIKANVIGEPAPTFDSRTAVKQMFSLVFRVPDNSRWSPQTFNVRHSQLGDLSLFLVHIGSDSEGTKYETIFM